MKSKSVVVKEQFAWNDNSNMLLNTFVFKQYFKKWKHISYFNKAHIGLSSVLFGADIHGPLTLWMPRFAMITTNSDLLTFISVIICDVNSEQLSLYCTEGAPSRRKMSSS